MSYVKNERNTLWKNVNENSNGSYMYRNLDQNDNCIQISVKNDIHYIWEHIWNGARENPGVPHVLRPHAGPSRELELQISAAAGIKPWRCCCSNLRSGRHQALALLLISCCAAASIKPWHCCSMPHTKHGSAGIEPLNDSRIPEDFKYEYAIPTISTIGNEP